MSVVGDGDATASSLLQKSARNEFKFWKSDVEFWKPEHVLEILKLVSSSVKVIDICSVTLDKEAREC